MDRRHRSTDYRQRKGVAFKLLRWRLARNGTKGAKGSKEVKLGGAAQNRIEWNEMAAGNGNPEFGARGRSSKEMPAHTHPQLALKIRLMIFADKLLQFVLHVAFGHQPSAPSPSTVQRPPSHSALPQLGQANKSRLPIDCP